MFPRLDSKIESFVEARAITVARLAIFVVFFWFGILKVLGLSPANPLVIALFDETLSFTQLTADSFLYVFGWFEMVIGILFLIPKLEKVAILVLVLHMVSTFLPLILLPGMTWAKPFVPTLEGQYIIKNIVIIALAMSIAAHITEDKD